MPNPFQILAVSAIAAAVGCQSAQPPPRVAVPQSPNEGGMVKTYPRLRPLPEPQAEAFTLPPPAFDDPPLVTQAPPEQPAYLEAYDRIGQPRVAVFVNRTIEGQLVPVAPGRDPIAGVAVSRSDGSSASAEVYLSRGQYDEAQAKAIDYEAIELVLADLLAANGRVTLISPTMARQRLTDGEVKDLQSGRPRVLREIAEKLDVDVLIQAQARPTQQTAEGLGIRVLVEALNTDGGESIARAFVDVPPPLEKTTINRFARFLARKTMYELASTWTAMANDDRPPTTQPQR